MKDGNSGAISLRDSHDKIKLYDSRIMERVTEEAESPKMNRSGNDTNLGVSELRAS